jgi:hypothetical protein
MNSFFIRLKSEEGNVMIIAFVLLVVLTLVGIFATRTAQLDLQTAYNEVPYKQNFYVAEGGVNNEAAEIAGGTYVVANTSQPQTLANLTNRALPGFPGKTYDPIIRYLGPFPPPSGYSALHFSRYDFSVTARSSATLSSGQVRVTSRFFKVGPKAE